MEFHVYVADLESIQSQSVTGHFVLQSNHQTDHIYSSTTHLQNAWMEICYVSVHPHRPCSKYRENCVVSSYATKGKQSLQT